jgi:hypothetical protein
MVKLFFFYLVTWIVTPHVGYLLFFMNYVYVVENFFVTNVLNFFNRVLCMEVYT